MQGHDSQRLVVSSEGFLDSQPPGNLLTHYRCLSKSNPNQKTITLIIKPELSQPVLSGLKQVATVQTPKVFRMFVVQT